MNTPPIPSTISAAPRTLVTFRLGRQIFALPIEPIVQIIPIVTITPLPHADPRVAGVINVHGALVPIINLHTLLNLPRPILQLHTPIVLVHCHTHTIGLIVDSVLEVFTPTAKDFTRPKEILPDELVEAPILAGMVNHTSGTVFVLDIDHILLPNQAEALELATAALFHDAGETASEEIAADLSPVELPTAQQGNGFETVQTAPQPKIDTPLQKAASKKKVGTSRKHRIEKEAKP